MSANACSQLRNISDLAVENSLRPLFISKIAIEKDGGAVGWEDLKMSFNFLTLQSSQLARIKEPTQVLPYMRFDKHITLTNGITVIAPQKSGEVISNSLSLTSVPDRILLPLAFHYLLKTVHVRHHFLLWKY